MRLEDAAREAGVHYQTVYRWVRQGELPAHKVRGAYDVDERELQRVLARRLAPERPPRGIAVRDWDRQVARLAGFILEGDERGATRLVERLIRSRVPVLDVCRRLIPRFLCGGGVGWEQGGVSVAEEHRASAIADRLVARLFVHPRGRRRGRCLVTTPPGERHALPAAMAAAVLRDDHWDVEHLATEVPEDDLSELAGRQGAFVVLSVTYPSIAPRAVQLRRRLEAEDVPVLLGHPGADLKDLVDSAHRLTAGTSRRS